MSVESIILVGVVLIVAILGGVWTYYANEKRIIAMRVWCQARGFEFVTARDRHIEERYPDFACLRQGDDRYGYNIIDGVYRDFTFAAFHYHYVTYTSNKHGRQAHSHSLSVVVVESPLRLKSLQIRPEGFFDKVGSFFGIDDINFESAEFSRRYHVAAPDRRWAFDVLHQEAIEFLLSAPPELSIEMQPTCAMARSSGRFTPDRFEAALETVVGLLERLPRSVRQELQDGP
jgi:hypothetical protein